MKNLPLLFFGILFSLAVSWTAVVLSANAQFGDLQPAAVDEGDPVYPLPVPGVAAQGRDVYISMGCVACHTQQIRGVSSAKSILWLVPDPKTDAQKSLLVLGPDIARGWGPRGTVARDYIYEPRVLLGVQRVGPDLADFGDRKLQAGSVATILEHLYDPRASALGSNMPPYRFLFKTQPIGDHPSEFALNPKKLAPADQPPAGQEIVPTERALQLAAYLQSRKINYELPETVNNE